MILTYFQRLFLQKIYKSVFKQDKYNFTKKIDFWYFHYEMSQKWQIHCVPFLKESIFLNILPQFPTHASTPPQRVFK